MVRDAGVCGCAPEADLGDGVWDDERECGADAAVSADGDGVDGWAELGGEVCLVYGCAGELD